MIYPANDNHLNTACELLEAGEVIVCPTDTLYGFSADAANSAAITRIAETKQRAQPASIMVANAAEIHRYGILPAAAEEEIRKILPGPFTILIRKSPNVLPDNLTLNSPLIGIRIPGLKFVLRLTQKFGRPIVTTSVNRHGEPALNNIEQITEQFPDIPVFRDTERTGNLASTIIDFSQTPPKVVRQGSRKYPV